MSILGESIKPKIIFLGVLFLGIMTYFLFYDYVYNHLGIKTKSERTIELGSKNYDLDKFIKKSSGTVKSISKIDSSTVGKKIVTVTLSKYNISRKVNFSVNVVDKDAPVVELKDENVTITKGDSYNILDNIVSVKDKVDGELNYQIKEIVNDKVDTNYYTINGSFDNNTVGVYTLEVKAVDKSNNVATSTFTINVEKPKVVTPTAPAVYSQVGSNGSASGIVNTATALIGSPYASGGASPSGFDCSGFVQYVYSQNGISISRSSSTQAYDGVGVNYSDAEPGDILIWGYSNGTITHSALYIGNDQMIHAANYGTGVIRSSVSGWTRGSDVQVLYVRRIVS